MPGKSELPIFRAVSKQPEIRDLLSAAEGLFRIADNFKMIEERDFLSLESLTHSVELARPSGGIWAADNTRLFNPDLKPDLPDLDEAGSFAKDFAVSSSLMPALGGPASWGDVVVGGTRLATVKGRERDDRELDRQFIFPVLVEGLPVVGGGGDFTLALGDGGDIIGFHGVWRELADAFVSRTVSREEVEESYRKTLDASGMKLESVTSYLAYYSAPASELQEFVYPVYVLGGTAVVDGQTVPLRLSTLPATEFGPRPVIPAPERPRPHAAKPGSGGGDEKPRERRGYTSPSTGQRVSAEVRAANPFEAGTSWIGVSGGLNGSKKNARGFVDGWQSAGWNVNFNWGDANAFESDWRRNDDTWVDAADFVFYTGHASMDGWVLADPDDDRLSFTEVGAAPASPGDLWGQNDLEWVTIAACGPLQDSILSPGGGDVLSRWDGAFDGLHLLMGYGAITFDNETEGRDLVKYARQGKTLRDAWFRTAKETQPATNGADAPDGPVVWTGVMWASKAGANPANDHAWGHGSVSADPGSPTSLSCMWTVC